MVLGWLPARRPQQGGDRTGTPPCEPHDDARRRVREGRQGLSRRPAAEGEGDQADEISGDSDPWSRVDGLEGYPRLYDRKLIQATLADGSTDTGWVYIMNKLPASAKVIQSGDWKKREDA